MTIAQIKKSSKNLHKLLPDFLGSRTTPYSLTDIQKLVCQMSGYENMELATAALESQEENESDSLGSFYRYPWTNIDAKAIASAVQGNPTKFNVEVVDIRSARSWFAKRQETLSPSNDKFVSSFDRSLLAIVNAGAEGEALVNELADYEKQTQETGKSLIDWYGDMSFATLSPKVGITVNWLSGWEIEDIKRVLKQLILPACSSKQFNVSSDAIDVIVGQVDMDVGPQKDQTLRHLSRYEPARITIDALSRKLIALLALCEGGWSKNWDENFSSEFDAEDQSLSSKFMRKYDERVRAQTRPLESLLARLAALETGSDLHTSLGYREGGDNLEFIDEAGGLNFVTVQMESKRLDQVMTMAVLSKYLASATSHGISDQVKPIDVVIITR